MHFTETGAHDFLEIFRKHKSEIRNFPGCTHLELLRDARLAHCYTTLSHWVDEGSLDLYRHSPLFEAVWKSVKPLFSGRTEAFSLAPYIEVHRSNERAPA